jgi:hypothetical protein
VDRKIDRRKAPRDTDRYREVTGRASHVIDEARLIRAQMSEQLGRRSEVRALRQMLRKQNERYPQGRYAQVRKTKA